MGGLSANNLLYLFPYIPLRITPDFVCRSRAGPEAVHLFGLLAPCCQTCAGAVRIRYGFHWLSFMDDRKGKVMNTKFFKHAVISFILPYLSMGALWLHEKEKLGIITIFPRGYFVVELFAYLLHISDKIIRHKHFRFLTILQLVVFIIVIFIFWKRFALSRAMTVAAMIIIGEFIYTIGFRQLSK